MTAKLHFQYLKKKNKIKNKTVIKIDGYQVLTLIKLRQVCALFVDVLKLSRRVSEIVYHLAERFDQAHGNTPSTRELQRHRL